MRLAALSDKRTATERRSDSGKKRRGVCRQGRRTTDFGVTTASAADHVIPTPVRDNRQKPDVRSEIEFWVKRKAGEGGQKISNILQAGSRHGSRETMIVGSGQRLAGSQRLGAALASASDEVCA